LIQKIEMNVNKTNAFLFVAFAAGMLFYFGRRLACPKNDEDDDIEVWLKLIEFVPSWKF